MVTADISVQYELYKYTGHTLSFSLLRVKHVLTCITLCCLKECLECYSYPTTLVSLLLPLVCNSLRGKKYDETFEMPLK